MKRIPEDAWHRDVDLALVWIDSIWRPCCAKVPHLFSRIYAEDEKKIIQAYIIMPALVYGVAKGAFRTSSNQIPKLTDLALARGQAGQVGKGLSRCVHSLAGYNVHCHKVLTCSTLKVADPST
jgi:hypothetical protein